MRKKGFTLIELLAVIVILAIIALIATPIILGIINDAREESNERSVELYASAVRNGIAAYQLREGKEVLPGTYNETNKLPFEVEYDGKVECETIDVYENGTVYVEGCTVNGGEKTYNYGEQQEILVNFNDVCAPVTTATTGNVPKGNYALGDEYTCEVKEGTSYTFFVLSKEGNKVNLIMDSNIREDGIPVKETNPSEEQKGLIEWIKIEHFLELGGDQTDWNIDCDNCGDNNYGPITSMRYLQELTKDWKTGKLIVSTFDDELETTHKMAQTIISSTRMPYFSEIVGAGCQEGGSCPLWMTNYLDVSSSRTMVSGVYGYWMLSSISWRYVYAHYIGYGINYTEVSSNTVNGIRPVITLKI